MASLKKLWYRFTGFSRIVGRDLEGNRFYEYPGSHGEGSRTKRVVKYARRMELWEYPQAQRRLPVQWTMWLTHTRLEPPTLEELHNDAVRQERLKQNVALLEARDAQTRISAPEPIAHHSIPRREVPERDVTPTQEVITKRAVPEITSASPDLDKPSSQETSPWEAADKPVVSQTWTPTVGQGRR